MHCAVFRCKRSHRHHQKPTLARATCWAPGLQATDFGILHFPGSIGAKTWLFHEIRDQSGKRAMKIMKGLGLRFCVEGFGMHALNGLGFGVAICHRCRLHDFLAVADI